MSTPPLYLGVDGHPGGWIAVRYEGEEFHDVQSYDTVEQLWTENSDATTILIDVPIGLSDDAAAREPEECARSVLGQRRNSVFNVPIRSILDEEDYQTANSEQKEQIGKGLQKQTHNIKPRIREVDELLRNETNGATQEVLRRGHPEVCFWALNGRSEMDYSKTGAPAAAFWERVNVLEAVESDIVEDLRDAGRTICEWENPEASNDDLLDAVVLALTAKQGNYQTLPDEPSEDSKGLRMEMVYSVVD